MQPVRIPDPWHLEQAPELAALSLLDAALATAIAAIEAAYPWIRSWEPDPPEDGGADSDVFPPNPPIPPVFDIAAEILAAAAGLRGNLVAYWSTRMTAQLTLSLDPAEEVPF